MTKKVTIVKDQENEIPIEIIEQAIIDIAKGFKKMASSRLSKRAVVLLVQDSVGPSRITKQQVAEVLDAAATLEKRYIKAKP